MYIRIRGFISLYVYRFRCDSVRIVQVPVIIKERPVQYPLDTVLTVRCRGDRGGRAEIERSTIQVRGLTR